MVREFELPDVGEGVAEGEIVSWLVEEGETVSEDQPVAEVETDKAVVEVPSPVDGSVREIHAAAGAIVPVGEVIITFSVEGEDEDVESPSTPENTTTGSDGATAETSAATDASDAKGIEDGTDSESPNRGSARVFAAPSARRMARELGVDIGRVEGSGPAGRVSAADVRAAAGNGQRNGSSSEATAAGSEATADEPAPVAESVDAGGEATGPGSEAGPGPGTGATSAGSAERDRTLAVPATRRVARELGVDLDRVPATEQRRGEAFVTSEAVEQYAQTQREAQAADAGTLSTADAEAPLEGEQPGERVPYRGIRRTIGEAMERSAYTAPHVTHHDTVDASGLVETRERLKPLAADRGVSLTYLPLVMQACVTALREFPSLNSSLDEENEEIVLKGEYNVGVAVGTDAGLMVPVVESVDRKGLLQVAAETNELIEKTRDRSIAREEMQGGTFTISNFGAIGGEYATPIVNYPETAILGLGAIEERPVAVEGEVLARPTLPLSLSIDHRVIDGATAARFTNRLGEYLEDPRLLLLD